MTIAIMYERSITEGRHKFECMDVKLISLINSSAILMTVFDIVYYISQTNQETLEKYLSKTY